MKLFLDGRLRWLAKSVRIHVKLLMFNEVGFLSEASATLSARKGPLACVSPLMLSESLFARKTLPALRTRVEFFACVDSLVYYKIRLALEIFPAVGTRQRVLTVDLLMHVEARFHRETLSAHQTREWLLPRVDSEMLDKFSSLDEAFSTFRAGVRMLAGVNLQMVIEI